MRNCIAILSVISVALLGCSTWMLWQNAVPLRVNVVGGPVFDAGPVSSRRPVIHVFKIENPNQFPVQINAPVTGCTCTTAELSASAIPPHGNVTVTLHVEPEDGSITGSVLVTVRHGRKTAETELLVDSGSSTSRVHQGDHA